MANAPRRTRFRWLALALIVLSVLALLFRSRAPAPAGPVHAALNAAAVHGAGATPDQAPAPARPAAGPAGNALFAFVPAPANAAVLEARLPALAKRICYVKLNQELIRGKGSPFWQGRPGEGRLVLPLPDGGEIAVVIDHSEMVGLQRFVSEGRIEGRGGSRALFSSSNGILHATIEDVERGTYSLRYGDGEVSQFFEVDEAHAKPCGGGITPVLNADTVAAIARRRLEQAEPKGPAETPSAPVAADTALAGPEIHVMMLYTQAVLNAVGSTAAVQGAFDLAIATVNSDLARSLITARVKLVKIQVVSYPGDELTTPAANWQSDMLTALQSTSDTGPNAMNEIHALRDQVGADLVNLIQLRDDTVVAGIAYILSTPTLKNQTDWEFNSFFGFSVVGYRYVNANSTLSHELGHNLGCAHDRENSPATGGAYSFSYGYRFNGANGVQYHTIMSYDPGIRIPYFSNPNIVAPAPISVPVGIAAGLPGEAYNAKTIQDDAFEVADYRLQTQTPYALGTLVNVATRGFVGLNDQQLIGGFVITGTQPKNILVRAAGPGLTTTFGLTGVLADPQLSLTRTDVSPALLVGSNDNWDQQAGAAGVSSAAVQAGAFAFSAGSKDSALFVSLNPGNYTVNITGVGGTTGNAMVEVYEVGASATKIVNLATRGYIDTAKPLIAGFVITGNAGQKKRVVIRARGPSLSQFGLNGASDPVMSVNNALGELLLINDDFSTDGTLGDSLNEAQIIATGFAPTDRREPCVILDLEPGIYTASVSPFSNSTQPAEAGIAVIEVFQVN